MLRRPLRRWLRARVHLAFDSLTADHTALVSVTGAATVEAAVLARRLDAMLSQARRLGDDLSLLDQPFSADLTMDQVLRRHPGSAAVLARYHLPACGGCAVRFDETLGEAAEAYGLELVRLLQDLQGLL